MEKSQTSGLMFHSCARVFKSRKIWWLLILNQVVFGLILSYALPAAVFHYCGASCSDFDSLNCFYKSGDYPVGLRVIRFAWELCGICFWSFAGVVLYSEIIRSWNGQTISWRRGWSFAWSNLKAILLWGVFTFLVNALIGWAGEEVGGGFKVAAMVARIIWSVLMVLIIPILSREGNRANPFDNFLRAIMLFGRVWKEVFLGVIWMLILGYLMVSLLAGMCLPVIFLAKLCAPLRPMLLLLSVPGGIFICWLAASFMYLVYAFYLCGAYIFASEGAMPFSSGEEEEAEEDAAE